MRSRASALAASRRLGPFKVGTLKWPLLNSNLQSSEDAVFTAVSCLASAKVQSSVCGLKDSEKRVRREQSFVAQLGLNSHQVHKSDLLPKIRQLQSTMSPAGKVDAKKTPEELQTQIVAGTGL